MKTTPIYYHHIEQGSDEWHAQRRGMITASAISRLLTGTGKPANNDTSRAQLLQLLAERITGESEPSFYGDDMARGHLLEPLARDIYAQHQAPVQECGFVTCDFDGTVIGYSPDGLVGDDGLIEIKSPRQKNHLRALLSDEVPAEYVSQVQTGLAVTGRAWCDFITYAPGLPLFIHRVKRDELAIAYLIVAAQAAEVELQRLMGLYTTAAAKFPATEPIQPEQEIIF
ncbi:MAG: YqaJ viral recombinase family protein [Cyanobium sp. 49614_E6]|jgi:putative phage-type endonuclease|nr:YqaJ viral recombinase family protein [Cyanobium sp. 49614_E6]MCE2836654.1 YqaJ viral recombinase family protein [Cyanobium sp. 49614_E6]